MNFGAETTAYGLVLIISVILMVIIYCQLKNNAHYHVQNLFSVR